MNTRISTRLFAIASATFFTLVMLAAVDGLAQHEHADARIALTPVHQGA